MYIVEKLEVLGLKEAVPHCLINTAYTNSQADRFLDSNEITHIKVKTGVKYGSKAARQYAIGAFCDHNGHGSIYIDWVWLNRALAGKEDRPETKKLRALLNIANANSGGDGIANLLMVECVMRDRDYNI